jgi:microtubule-associated protein-like 1/2
MCNDLNFNMCNNLNFLKIKVAEHLGGIRTVSEGRGSQLLVGSTRNCILIGSLSMGFSPAVLGHTDELWALCPHPTLAQFLTAGFDRIVQLWDSLSHSVVWSKDIAVSITGTILTILLNTL